MVSVRVLLVLVSFRFKFKVLCTHSVFILLARKKVSMIPLMVADQNHSEGNAQSYDSNSSHTPRHTRADTQTRRPTRARLLHTSARSWRTWGIAATQAGGAGRS